MVQTTLTKAFFLFKIAAFLMLINHPKASLMSQVSNVNRFAVREIHEIKKDCFCASINRYVSYTHVGMLNHC